MLTSQLVESCRTCFINPSITGYNSCQECINSTNTLKFCSNCLKNRVIFGFHTCNECKNKFYSTTKYVEKKERGIHPKDCDHPPYCLNFKIVPSSRGREFSRCKKCSKFLWNDSKDYDYTVFELDSCYLCGYKECHPVHKGCERKWDIMGNIIPIDRIFKERNDL